MSALKFLMRWQVNTQEPMRFGVGTDWGKRPRRDGRSQEVRRLQWPERRRRLTGVSGSSGIAVDHIAGWDRNSDLLVYVTGD